MRIRLFEFEDLPWFPGIIREGGTDFLRYILSYFKFYEPVAHLLLEGMQRTGDNTIIDLCSGGGGNIEELAKALAVKKGSDINIILSDKFPNINAYEYLKQRTKGAINYAHESVDASLVPPQLKGFRTMFSAVHHFEPETIKAILSNAISSRQAIGIFDGGDKNIFTIAGIFLFHPLAFLLLTPFFKPFKWSRLFFTYILPFIPLYTIWDGFVSILRLYKPGELLTIAQQTGNEYEWKAGKLKNRFGMHVTYLVGFPKAS